MPKILYLTRNGLLEPLGQSQIMAYLRGLSRDYRIILITREKDEDWANDQAVARVRTECEALGIDWRPSPFRPKPRYVGPARDIVAMTRDVIRAVRREGVRLIHARSYIPSAVAWAVWRLTGTPFIFDLRAFWTEELITAGRLRRGSLLHRVISTAERICLRDAAAVVSVTHAGVDYLRECWPKELARPRVVVIPTCADLDRFAPPVSPKEGPRVYGCIGTVLSGWFRIDWLAAWCEAAALDDPCAQFEILTRDDPALVRAAVDPRGRLGKKLSIGVKRQWEMPDAIRGHDLSLMFYAGDQVSELGRSPVRMAEVLGTGLPVVTNTGVGDVAKIVRDHRVGVLLEGPEGEKVTRAMRELRDLFADPGLAERCRKAAEAVFSLEGGTEAYRQLYRDVLGPTR